MAVAIYEVNDSDSPNTGRLKWNNSDANLKTAVDANTTARTGIGSVVGTTATQTLSAKTLASSNAGGTNVITITREDISGNFISFTSDSGTKTITVNGASMTDIDVLGSNGIQTSVTGGVIYIEHPAATVLNSGSQTLAVARSAVVGSFTVDVDGHMRVTDGIAIGADHTNVSSDKLHIKDSEAASYVSAAIQNTLAGGAQLKLMEDLTSEYWFLRYDAGANNGLSIGFTDVASGADVAIAIAKDVDDGTLAMIAGNKIGIGMSVPSYNLHIASGIGIDSDQLVLDPTTGMRLDHPGSGTVNWKSDTDSAIQVKANGSVGIGGNANDSYALVVTGNMVLAGATTVSNTFTISGLASLNGGISVDTNKFTVADVTGDTAIAGTLGVTGAATLSSTLSVADDVTLTNGKNLIVETIKAVDSTGLDFKTTGGTSSAFVDNNANFRVADSLTNANSDEKFGVKGKAIFVAEDASNKITIWGDASGNYIDTADYDSDGEQDLKIRIAGSTAKDFYIQSGPNTNPASVGHTNLFIDGGTEKISLNEHPDGIGASAKEVLNIYGAVGNAAERSCHFHIGDSTGLGINAYYDSPDWKRTNVNNAARIQLSDSQLTLSVTDSNVQGSTITWKDSIRINNAGQVGILESPDVSYSLTIVSGLNSGSFNTGVATVTELTASTSIETEALTISPGTTSITIEDDVAVTTPTRDALVLKKSGSGYTQTTPRVILRNSTGDNHAMLEGTTVGTDKRAAFTSYDPSNFYVYSTSIRAGDHLQAGGDGVGTPWCPVPYTVYAEPGLNTPLLLNGVSAVWSKTVNMPYDGIYKATVSFYLDFNNYYDGKQGQIWAELGGAAMGDWLWKGHIQDGEHGKTSFRDSFSALLYRSAGTSSFVIHLGTCHHLSTAYLYSVHLEWIAASTFNA